MDIHHSNALPQNLVGMLFQTLSLTSYSIYKNKSGNTVCKLNFKDCFTNSGNTQYIPASYKRKSDIQNERDRNRMMHYNQNHVTQNNHGLSEPRKSVSELFGNPKTCENPERTLSEHVAPGGIPSNKATLNPLAQPFQSMVAPEEVDSVSSCTSSITPGPDPGEASCHTPPPVHESEATVEQNISESLTGEESLEELLISKIDELAARSELNKLLNSSGKSPEINPDPPPDSGTASVNAVDDDKLHDEFESPQSVISEISEMCDGPFLDSPRTSTPDISQCAGPIDSMDSPMDTPMGSPLPSKLKTDLDSKLQKAKYEVAIEKVHISAWDFYN